MTLVLLLGLGATALAADAPPAEITFVANAENQSRPRVQYTGRAWAPDAGGFLVGTGRGHRLLADAALGAGDFRLNLELALPRADRASLLVLGSAGEVVMSAGGGRWQVRGRFFRAADQPVEVQVPEVKAGRPISVQLERRGETASLTLDGQTVYVGPCGPGALGSCGLDPDSGAVHLYTFSARGRFAGVVASKPFGNRFGLQLRPPPRDVASVLAPVILREAPTNEASIVARRDGTMEIYTITKPESDSVSVIRSGDGGLTWGPPEVAFRLPGRAYYAIVVLEDTDGGLQAVYHILGDGPGGYRGRLYEVYHVRQRPGAPAWSAPVKVVPGYVGSINGFIQLRSSGRLVLAVARAVPEREQPPWQGPDRGWNDTFVYWSDDFGATWRVSPDQLSLVLESANVTRYGAIEPALLERRDGTVWMLVRDRGGRLWQSESRDGERWAPLTRTGFISSDSPADLLRLRDGRVVLLTNACQNWSDPRSYAMGGREVLHAALSRDEGRTWSGFREILHETDIVSGGDRGTSYASLAENRAGKVVVVSGQGEGKRAVVMFDPAWLEAEQSEDDLSLGPVQWTHYGDDGVEAVATDDGPALSIPLESSGLLGAQWNFPSADAGEVRLRVRVPRAVVGLRLSLTDHFSRIDDGKAADHAVWTMEPAQLPGLADHVWHDLVLRWTKATGGGQLVATIDGNPGPILGTQRPAQFGVNYLRVEFRARSDQGAVLLRDVRMRKLP